MPRPTSWRCWRALGTVGVFALFAMASGIMRLSGKDQGNPLLKAVVDKAFDGILVTDQAGRVFYANATYLDLIGAKRPATTCGRSSGCSSAIRTCRNRSSGC